MLIITSKYTIELKPYDNINEIELALFDLISSEVLSELELCCCDITFSVDENAMEVVNKRTFDFIGLLKAIWHIPTIGLTPLIGVSTKKVKSCIEKLNESNYYNVT